MLDDVVLVDTDVWSCVVRTIRDRDPRVATWRRLLLGNQLVIAAQTEGELRYWGLSRQWGTERLAALEAHLARTPTVPVTTAVVKAFASIRATCKSRGKPLADKQHMGDAWVAATAVAYALPLLSGDAIYDGVEGLLMLSDDND